MFWIWFKKREKKNLILIRRIYHEKNNYSFIR